MVKIAYLDKMVGEVAGAIYTSIQSQFPHPPLVLVPAITFKVRKLLEQAGDIGWLSKEQKAELAHDIRISLAPMLFSYEFDAATIEQIMPLIELVAFKALEQTGKESSDNESN